MKRFTLLFLALSSLTFAGVSIKEGNNTTSSVGTNTASAGINVNVSATVTDTGTELYIADANGNQISDVSFHHVLQAGNVGDQGDGSLTANLSVQGNALSNAGTFEHSFGNSSLTLTNNGNNLTSNLEASTGIILDQKKATLTVKSNLKGNAVAGEYTSQATTLTVTYNKTSATSK